MNSAEGRSATFTNRSSLACPPPFHSFNRAFDSCSIEKGPSIRSSSSSDSRGRIASFSPAIPLLHAKDSLICFPFNPVTQQQQQQQEQCRRTDGSRQLAVFLTQFRHCLLLAKRVVYCQLQISSSNGLKEQREIPRHPFQSKSPFAGKSVVRATSRG